MVIIVCQLGYYFIFFSSFLLQAPLAAFAENIEDDTKNFEGISKLFHMSNLSLSNKSRHSLDNNDWKRPQRMYRPKKSLSTVVLHPILNIPDKHPNARIVRIRLVFIRIGKKNIFIIMKFMYNYIGEIDTLNEKYQADIYFEAKWAEKRVNINTFNLTPQQITQLLHENMTVKINEFNSVLHWTPQLFIENAIGQIGEQDKWFTMKKAVQKTDQSSSPLFINVDICEHRRIKGIFWEKLELNHVNINSYNVFININGYF